MLIRTLLALCLFAPLPAVAQDSIARCGPDDTLQALVSCVHEAAAMLPADKQASVQDRIDRTAHQIDGTRRPDEENETSYPDYGWQAASALLDKGGAEALFEAARNKSGLLRYGRAEALLATGIRAAGFGPEDEAVHGLAGADGLAARINRELLALAGPAGEFERGDLAQAAAQLAALRCDASTFRAARQMTLMPDALRYEFWSARIEADRSGLPGAIMRAASAEDTAPVRQALEGIAFLHVHGHCPDAE